MNKSLQKYFLLLIFLASCTFASYAEKNQFLGEISTQEGETFFFTEDDKGKLNLKINRKQGEFFFENKISLIEYKKLISFEDMQAAIDFGLPTPDYVGEKFFKTVYSPSLKYITANRKNIFFAASDVTHVKDSNGKKTFIEGFTLNFKRRVDSEFKGKLLFYAGVEFKQLKQYNYEYNQFIFNQYYTKDIFSSIELNSIFPRTFVELNVGFRADNYSESYYVKTLIIFPLSQEVLFISDFELLRPYKIENKFFFENKIKKYFSKDLKIGIKIEPEKNIFFLFLFTKKDDNIHRISAQGLDFISIWKF